MARKPRIEYPGAFYHIIARGNKREDIFLDQGDRIRFINKLSEYKKRYDFILYAYTLMNNHFHLLLETNDVPASRIMQGIIQAHTQYYNLKYDKVGHVFQGRYKAILCDRDNYLLNLVRYIHLNPVRAGLVTNPADYKWTSHRIFLGVEKSELVDKDFVLSQFSNSRAKAVRLYEEFVIEWLGEDKKDEFYKTIDKRFLGDEDFVTQVKDRIGEKQIRDEITLRDKSFADVVKKVKEITGVDNKALCGKSRSAEIAEARSLFVRLCLLYTNHKRKEIAGYLGRVPRIISYLEYKISQERWDNIQRKLGW